MKNREVKTTKNTFCCFKYDELVNAHPVQLSQPRVVVLPLRFQVEARCCGDELC